MTKQNDNWNLDLILESNYSPEFLIESNKKCNKAVNEFAEKRKADKTWLENSGSLLIALNEYNDLLTYPGPSNNVDYYLGLATDLDQNNSKLRGDLKIVSNQIKDRHEKIRFFTQRLARVDKEKQKEFLLDSKLKEFHNFLSQLFEEGKHLLSEEGEKIISKLDGVSYSNWFEMINSLLSNEAGKINGQDFSFEELLCLMSSQNQEERDSAAQAFNLILENNIDVATRELNSILEYKKVTDELRGFDRPDAETHLDDGVDTKVVDVLVESVQKRNDIARRYYALKAKVLGKEKLAYHERNVEVGDFSKEYSWAEASDLVIDTFQSIDSRFGKMAKGFFEDSRIDVFPKNGKTGGAYCTLGNQTAPVYILLNFTKKISDITTLAHELGHGLNHELINQNQKIINQGSSFFTAEVASTFMEDFVLEKILSELDKKQKFSLIMHKLNSDISTIFRQVACYRFEQVLHQEFRKKGFLSKEEVGEMFQKYMSEYMGDFVEQSQGCQNWWLYWSHIRRYFYVYSYAGGLLISKYMQKSYRNNPEFVEKIYEYLKTGGSLSPSDSFAKMGVDINDSKVWDQGLDEVEQLLEKAEGMAKNL